jgi:hypothetical protein
MEKENFFIKALTPKDTEEIKPGLFIQRKLGGYRNVYPAAWNGKIIWANFLFGGSVFKTIGWFAIILFVVWSYQHDVAEYKEFYEKIQQDPFAWCLDVQDYYVNGGCTKENQAIGLCDSIDYNSFNATINLNSLA